MNTNNRIVSKILNLLYLLISFSLYVALSLTAYNRTVGGVAWGMITALLGIFGAIICHIVHIFLHELGHYLGIKLSGGEILGYGLFFVRGVKLGKKFKLKRQSFSSGQGYIEYVSKKPENTTRTFNFAVIGGFVASFLVASAVIVNIALAKSFFLFGIFGVGGSAVVYSFFCNFLSFSAGSDGQYLFMSREDTNESVLKRMETESRLFVGETLAEMPETLFDGTGNLYYKYLRKLEMRSTGEASAVLNALINECGGIDYAPIELKLEKFFISVLEGDKAYLTVYKNLLVSYSDTEYTPTLMRILAVYYKYSGESEWSKAVVSSLRKCVLCPLKGLVKTENTILDNFLDSLPSEP